MTTGLVATTRHRPTPGFLYVGAIGAFTVLVLALVQAGLLAPLGVVIIGVPLGPIGVAVAGLALPALAVRPSLSLDGVVLTTALAIAALNVALAVTMSAAASRRLARIREDARLR